MRVDWLVIVVVVLLVFVAHMAGYGKGLSVGRQMERVIMAASPDGLGGYFNEWLDYALKRRWVAPGVCQTHDMVPMTPDEMAEFDDGGDPCVPILRVWTERT